MNLQLLVAFDFLRGAFAGRAGSGAAALKPIDAAGSGLVYEAGVGAAAFEPIIAAATGFVGEDGFGIATFSDVIVSAYGNISESGSGSASLGSVSCLSIGVIIPAADFLVSVVTVTNRSPRTVSIPYSDIVKFRNVTDIRFNRQGTLNLFPNRTVTIEEERVPAGEFDRPSLIVLRRVVDVRKLPPPPSGFGSSTLKQMYVHSTVGLSVPIGIGASSFGPIAAHGFGFAPDDVTLVSITNRSRQLIRISYSSIDPSRNVSAVAAARQGTLDFLPGRSATIELERTPDGEIDRLVGDGFISVSKRNLTSIPA